MTLNKKPTPKPIHRIVTGPSGEVTTLPITERRLWSKG